MCSFPFHAALWRQQDVCHYFIKLSRSVVLKWKENKTPKKEEKKKKKKKKELL